MGRGVGLAFALMLAGLTACGYPLRYCPARGEPQARLCAPCNQGDYGDCKFSDPNVQCWATSTGPRCRKLCSPPWHFACDGKCHFTPFKRQCYDAGPNGC